MFPPALCPHQYGDQTLYTFEAPAPPAGATPWPAAKSFPRGCKEAGLGRPHLDKRSSMPQPKTRPDSPVPSLQGPCDRSLKSEEP